MAYHRTRQHRRQAAAQNLGAISPGAFGAALPLVGLLMLSAYFAYRD